MNIHLLQSPPPPASYPGAVVGHAAAAGQAGVEVRDAVRAADRSVLVDLTAAVDVTAPGQVPLGHGEGGSAGGTDDAVRAFHSDSRTTRGAGGGGHQARKSIFTSQGACPL